MTDALAGNPLPQHWVSNGGQSQRGEEREVGSASVVPGYLELIEAKVTDSIARAVDPAP